MAIQGLALINQRVTSVSRAVTKFFDPSVLLDIHPSFLEGIFHQMKHVIHTFDTIC